MSFLTKLFGRREQRSAESGDLSFANIFGIGSPSSGMTVTADTALSTSAFFAGVNLIANGVATLPIKAYRTTDRGREIATGHAANRVLHRRPNPEMTPFRFLWWIVASAVIWGTGWAEIQRDRAGRPVALWPIHPTRVRPRRSPSGELLFEITNNTGQPATFIRDADILRVFVFTKDGISGYGLLYAMAETIGLQLAMDKYSGAYFANAATPTGLLELPETVTGPQVDDLRKSWQEQHRGPTKAGSTAVLPPGVKFNAIGIDPKASQLIEAKRFLVSDFARFLNIPITRLRNLDRATWSNYEQESIAFIQETLLPWLTAFEQECTVKLFTKPEADRGMFAKFTVNGFLRADVATRSKFYTDGLRSGIFSINEVRAWEDLNSIGPDGDTHLVQMQMTPVGESQPGDTQPTGEGSEDAGTSNRSASGVTPDAAGPALQPIVRDTAGRVTTREIDRLRRGLKRNQSREAALTFVDAFYGDTNYADDAFKPIAATYATITGATIDTAAVVQRHATGARDELRAIIDNTIGDDHVASVEQRIAAWAETRADALATAIMEQFA